MRGANLCPIYSSIFSSLTCTRTLTQFILSSHPDRIGPLEVLPGSLPYSGDPPLGFLPMEKGCVGCCKLSTPASVQSINLRYEYP